MRILGTFATRNIADSMKDRLAEHGFDPNSAVVMVNRATPEPPEDAQLEVGTEGVGGFTGFEEKLGKSINSLLGKEKFLEGTGSEGAPNAGALLSLRVKDDGDAQRAKELLTLHQAADIEVVSD